MQFSLVVDNLVIKYVGRKHIDNLTGYLKKHYPISANWKCKLYYGIFLY